MAEHLMINDDRLNETYAIQAYFRQFRVGGERRRRLTSGLRDPPSEAVLNGPKFPLLCLPDDEIRLAIRVMDFIQIIDLSLLSERCKNLVKSVKIQGIQTNVVIQSDFIVRFKFEESACELKFWNWEKQNGTKRRLKAPLEVALTYSKKNKEEKRMIFKDQYEMKDWMEHFYTIFHRRGIDSLRFDAPSLEYDPQGIKEIFGVPSQILTVNHTGNHDRNQTILRTFLPVESLSFPPFVYRKQEIPPELFIQNFNMLGITGSRWKTVKLNDLLISNSKIIVIKCARIGPKNFNKFIQLWQNGANPRMECLLLDYDDDFDHRDILKGIKYTEISEDEERWFRFSDRRAENIMDLRGGMEIVRKDGVTATFRINVDQKRYVMLVWFDHCIALDGPGSK